MKAVPISIILFLILIICIVANAIFINESSSYLSDASNALYAKNDREATLDKLEAFWESRRDIIGLSVSNLILDEADDVIICLREAERSGDEAEFQKYRMRLSDISKKVARAEKLSIGNIF